MIRDVLSWHLAGSHSSCRYRRSGLCTCPRLSLDSPFWGTRHDHFCSRAAICFSTVGCAMQDAQHLASPDHSLPFWGVRFTCTRRHSDLGRRNPLGSPQPLFTTQRELQYFPCQCSLWPPSCFAQWVFAGGGIFSWSNYQRCSSAILVRPSAIPQYWGQPKRLRNCGQQKLRNCDCGPPKFYFCKSATLQSPASSDFFLSLFLSSGCF